MEKQNRKTGIIAECVCDLPSSTLKALDVEVLYFTVETEYGIFTDTDEITADNVIAYMEAGGTKTKSSPPDATVYLKAFENALKQYDEVILVAISEKISLSVENASAAVKMLGNDAKRVHIFDSMHLSTGLGFLVKKAATLSKEGLDASTILSELEIMRSLVCTSFIAKNANYLYRNGLVSLRVKNICEFLHIHPVLAMKNGKLTLSSIYIGNYDNAAKRYIKKMLKAKEHIDPSCLYITSVGCNVKMLKMISQEVDKNFQFKEVIQTSASATVSSNCGPGTFGILFVKKPL